MSDADVIVKRDWVQCVWIEAELLGEHVHVRVKTGRQYNMRDVPLEPAQFPGVHMDAGGAGTLILRVEQWPSYIKAFAVGGYATGLRVIWRGPYTPLIRQEPLPDRQPGEDRRKLWNGHPEYPCIYSETRPVSWEPPEDDGKLPGYIDYST